MLNVHCTRDSRNTTHYLDSLHVFVFYPPGRRTAYNWLTGSSVDTLAEHSLSSESLSSLLVFDKKERQTTARRPVGEGFGLRRLAAPSDEVDSRTRGSSHCQTSSSVKLKAAANGDYVNFLCVSTAENEQRSNILRLRRRFLKDQEKVSMNYAQKEIRQQRQKKVPNNLSNQFVQGHMSGVTNKLFPTGG